MPLFYLCLFAASLIDTQKAYTLTINKPHENRCKSINNNKISPALIVIITGSYLILILKFRLSKTLCNKAI